MSSLNFNPYRNYDKLKYFKKAQKSGSKTVLATFHRIPVAIKFHTHQQRCVLQKNITIMSVSYSFYNLILALQVKTRHKYEKKTTTI